MNTPIVCCILGALAVQLLQLTESFSKVKDSEPIHKKYEFYFGALLSMAIAAIVGYIYFEKADVYGRIVYFHTGASAPILLKTLADSLPAAVKPRDR